MSPLIDFLERRGRIGTKTHAIEEFSWLGRRVDLATLASSRVTSAFELKVDSFSRALEQAVYNRASFDRSYVVISQIPLGPNLDTATQEGVGVILVRNGAVKVIAESPLRRPPKELRRKLLRQFRNSLSSHV